MKGSFDTDRFALHLHVRKVPDPAVQLHLAGLTRQDGVPLALVGGPEHVAGSGKVFGRQRGGTGFRRTVKADDDRRSPCDIAKDSSFGRAQRWQVFAQRSSQQRPQPVAQAAAHRRRPQFRLRRGAAHPRGRDGFERHENPFQFFHVAVLPSGWASCRSVRPFHSIAVAKSPSRPAHIVPAACHLLQ